MKIFRGRVKKNRKIKMAQKTAFVGKHEIEMKGFKGNIIYNLTFYSKQHLISNHESLNATKIIFCSNCKIFIQ